MRALAPNGLHSPTVRLKHRVQRLERGGAGPVRCLGRRLILQPSQRSPTWGRIADWDALVVNPVVGSLMFIGSQ